MTEMDDAQMYPLWLKVNRNGWTGLILGGAIFIFGRIIAAIRAAFFDPSVHAHAGTIVLEGTDAILLGLGLGIFFAGGLGVIVSDLYLDKIKNNSDSMAAGPIEENTKEAD